MKPCEVSWFSALCDDDYEYLGVPEPALRSSYEHCGDIVRTAERNGFDNILLPSGYALGIDTVAFAAAMAPQLKRMRLLVAVRCGEVWPPQLVRQLGHDRPHAGRAAHHQHHLERDAGRSAGVGTALHAAQSRS
jgi:alkanesulfonate monooxygenase